MKPQVKLSGKDGNVFNLISIASEALKNAGQKENANHLMDKVFECSSYEEAIQLISNYCEIS